MKNRCAYTKLISVVLTFIALYLPNTSFATFSIGQAAENLMVPTEILTKLLLISCYIIGIALILGAIVQYKIHRQSPKLVPLTTPITLLVLGLISVMIPYGTKIFGTTYSAEGQSYLTTKENVLPLPDTSKKPALIPLPPLERAAPAPRQAPPSYQNDPQYSAPPPPPPPKQQRRAAPTHSGSSGGGHWTSDPQYR